MQVSKLMWRDPATLDVSQPHAEGNAVDASRADGYVLELREVSKSFGGIPALSDVIFNVRPGEVVAVIGENGAGKSTLMKIISGVYPTDSYQGELLLDGRPARFRTVRDAEAAGIVLVPQELYIAPNLSIAENMFMGMLPSRRGFVDEAKLFTLAMERLAFFGVQANPNASVGELSPSAQRLVTIASALSKAATRVLILDEPTASLTQGEAVHLFERIAQIKAQNVGCIYITHRLDEIAQVADRVVVMRNGRVVEHFASAQDKISDMVRAMIGHDPEPSTPRVLNERAAAVLTVSNLSVHEGFGSKRCRVDNVSLELRRGEVLGLFGLVGAGRTELAKAIFGAWQGTCEGEIRIDGERVHPRSPAEAISLGIGMLTEDRKRTGLIEGHSVLHNISAASIRSVSSGPFIRERDEVDRNRELIRKLDLRPPRLDAKVEWFSGGNQQKVLLARWIAIRPRILIVDEPTYGVDIGARQEIYRLLHELAAEGTAVLMISSDMTEILDESDRVLVMYKGRVTQSFDRKASRHELMAAATGEIH
ncbi:sugar ABC transporter ATP-binding protein [Paraburkholderia youngii]|uniref:sugar ABC transporter ATP-binding protein n=1 Tax=Paraburkholderia youngii TaxID=2782701 RepID=UPI0015917D48|nr:sugar ABC transporter ATP-binding protein [Paraburkholderia youngii]NUX54736.1 sugar ABC transporter ATP-binding protein [Paraburkholderia youngii]